MRSSPRQALDIAHLRALSQSPPRASARLPADRRAVARALTIARRFAEGAGIGPDCADKLAVVVEEWVANLVEHGAPPAESRIGLVLVCEPGLLRLTVTDAGRVFDPRAAVFEGPNLERGGGAGLELIRAWCRISAYGRRSGRNRLVLEMPLA